MPSAAAGEVVVTELQQSIFNAPPSAAIASLPPRPPGQLKPPVVDQVMEDAKSPTTSIAGTKRPREEEEEEEDSEGDVAMEEDSDDDE